jgi:hypothetical protein
MTKESASAYDFLSSFDIDLTTVTKLGGNYVSSLSLSCHTALYLR